jgi:TonB family protein
MRRPPSRYTLLTLSGAPHDTTAFDGEGHASAAVGTAVLVHAIVLLIAASLGRLQPPAPADARLVSAPIARFIFTDRVGDGAGQSRGGNQSKEPAPLARSRGTDAHAVAASPARPLDAPESIAPERDPAPALPVVAMTAGDLAQVGALDGVPGPPTDARGPGDSGSATRPGSDRGLGGAPGDGVGEKGYGIGNGVTSPTLIHRTQPQYSAEAMRAKLQGVAVLSGVVGIDGTLHDIRVVRSLDAAFGLDREAIACVRQWRFRPGTREGTPVAVYVTIEVAFTLR